MKEKIDQMNKVIQYGDEKLVMNMLTGEIVGHVVTAKEKKSILTVVAQKIVRMFTA
jgi:predicted Ser/Thr protein kinase